MPPPVVKQHDGAGYLISVHSYDSGSPVKSLNRKQTVYRCDLWTYPTSHVRTANNAMSLDGLCEVGQECMRACVQTQHSKVSTGLVLDRRSSINLQYWTGLIHSPLDVRSVLTAFTYLPT